METFKKFIKRFILIAFLLLAATGVGLFGAVLPSNRQAQNETQPKIELVHKEEEQEEESDEEKDNS